MKKRILIILITLISTTVWGQYGTGIRNHGAKVVVDQGATIKISGSNADFTNYQDGKVDLDGTIDIKGNWYNKSGNDSLFINLNNVGSVKFSGNSAQFIGGTNYTEFENLYLNNSSGVTLGYFTRVDSILSLTSTILDLDQFDLRMGSINNLTGSFGVNNMIITSNGGSFQFKPRLASYMTIPLGDNSGTNEYSRLYFYLYSSTILGPNAYISTSVANSKHPNNASTTNYLNRYWTMNTYDVTNLYSNVYAYYSVGDVSGTESALTAGEYVDPYWKQINNYVYTGSHYTRFLYLHEYGDFTAGEAENFDIDMTIANEAVINEGAENGSTILVTLDNASFVASPSLSNWQVNNLPVGVTLSSITYLTPATVRLTLTGNRTVDYDTDISNVEVIVNYNDVNNLNSGTLSASSGVTLTADNDDESLTLGYDGNITEGSENGEIITVTLSGGTFADPVNSGAWVLNNLPSGVNYSISRAGATLVNIYLTSNTNIDYDDTITTFEVIVPGTDIDDYSGTSLSVNTGVKFTPIVESLTAVMTMVNPPIDEGLEGGESILVTISGSTFVDTLTDANWSVGNLPEGVSWVSAVQRISDTEAQITLSGSRIYDYDYNISNVSVTIDAAEFNDPGPNVVVSSGVTLTANPDPESLSLSVTDPILEGQEDGKSVSVTLTGGTFYPSPDKSKWTVLNLPPGVSIDTVINVDVTHATITLAGNSTVDYDSNIDFNLSIDKSQLSDVSAALTVTGQDSLQADNDTESLLISGNINEGEEDGSIIQLELIGGIFNSTISESDITVSVLPAGVQVGQVNYINDTIVELVLVGNATADYDSDIIPTIGVAQAAFTDSDGNISANSGATFVAVDEPAEVALTAPTIIESNENGKVITVNLSQDNFTGLVANTNFFVHNLPDGVTIGSFSYTNSQLEITLSGTRNIDFDTDINNIYVEVLGSALVQHTYDISSNNISIKATDDPESIILLSQNITEGSEDGAVITAVLTGGTFIASPNSSNWVITNSPDGVSVGSLNRKSNDTVEITLAGNATADYDSDISMSMTIGNSEFDDYEESGYVISGGVTFKATIEPISMTIENNGGVSITEGHEDGAEILVSIQNDEFVPVLNRSDWVASNLPAGVSVDTFIRQANNTDVIIKLAGSSTKDYDQNIDTVKVEVLGSQFVHQNVDLMAKTGVLITADNDIESLSFVTTSITERQENLADIVVNLTGGTFVNLLDKGSWSITGQPSGVEIGAVTRNSDTVASITLMGNSDTDFDTDNTSLQLTVLADQVDDHPDTDGDLTASGNVTFVAVDESVSYTIPTGSINEDALDGSIVELSLAGDQFVDYALEPGNFILNNVPPGVTVSAIEYVDESHAKVRFAYDRTDFDTDFDQASITVKGNEIVSGSDITTSVFTISAVIELPFIELSDNGLVEGSENSGYIRVTLYEDEFKNTLNMGNWTVENLPEGVSASSLDRIDSVTVDIILAGDRTKDYDNSLTNTSVTIAASELVGGLSDVTAASGVIFIALDDNESISLTPLTMYEGEEDGNTVTVNLTGGTFSDPITPSGWEIINLPSGVTANISRQNSVTATIQLSGNRNTDYDNDITNFQVRIPSTDINDVVSGYTETNTGVTFKARHEDLSVSVSELNEATLNGATLVLSLIDDHFSDNILDVASFTIQNKISGLSVQSVNYINDTAASVILAFDNHDFDTDGDIKIVVDKSELFGLTNLSTGDIPIIAVNDDEVLSMSADGDGIYEAQEAGEIITVDLTGGTFNSPLSTDLWEITGLPEGVTYNINFISLTEVQVELLTNTTQDYDSNLTTFRITVPADDVSDYSGSNLIPSGSVVFNAYDESLGITASLAENNLDGNSVSLVLSNEKFADATLSSTNFILNNAPIGLSISSVNYVSDTEATLSLAFDNTDFDDDITDFNVTILESELRGVSDLSSDSITISAIQELESITISHSGLTEENLNGAVISLLISNAKFADASLILSNFVLNNATLGCSISDVSYLTDSTANVSIQYDGTDFDANREISITVKADELSVTSSITSNKLIIQATDDPEIISLTSASNITEGAEDGAVITVTVEGGDFVASPDFANWVVNDLPDGVSAINFTYVNTNSVIFQLSGNRTQDYDSNRIISIFIPSGDVYDVSGDISSSNNLTLYAVNDDEVVTMADDGEILEGAEDGEVIMVNLTGGTFAESLNAEWVSITNLPIGVGLGTVQRISSTQFSITLAGNRTADYDGAINAILNIQGDVINDYADAVYTVNTGVTFIGAYELNDRILSVNTTGMSEANLSGLVIPLSISHDQLADANLSVSSIVLDNAPTGVGVASVSYVSNNELQVVLSYDGTDFDTDVTDFDIEILGSELVSGVNLVSASQTITAIVEAPAFTISNPGLNELNLNGAQVAVNLSNDTFVDESISLSELTLNNAPVGLSVNSFTYTDSVSGLITLSFDGTDFDTDITNFSISIGAVELTSAATLTSNNLIITAINESGSVVASISQNMTETNLNGFSINLKLVGDTYIDNSLVNTSFILSGIHKGLSVGAINYVANNEANLILNFAGNDFDSDFSFTITVKGNELSADNDLISNALSVQAVNDEESILLSTVDSIAEGAENGAVITAALSGGTFVDPVQQDLWSLTNLPTGVSIDTVELLSLTQARITLTGNTTVDYDIDKQVALILNESQVDDFSGADLSSTNNIVFHAIIEQPTVQISAGSLTEADLNGQVVDINLNSTNFLTSSLKPSDFTLIGAPLGLSITQVQYVNDNYAQLTLAFDSTDFDSDQVISVKVDSTIISASQSISSNSLTITALNDDEYFVMADDGEILEGSENGEIITLVLHGGTFKHAIDISAWQFTNLPVGVVVGSGTVKSDTLVELTLSGNTQVDYDTSMTQFSVGIPESAFDDYVGSTFWVTGGVTFIGQQENSGLLASHPGLTEQNLDGAVINLKLIDAKFTTGVSAKSAITLNNGPDGLSVADYTILTDSTAKITLDFLNIDFDSDYPTFSITIDGAMLTPNSSVTSNALPIKATIEPVVLVDYDGEILEGAEDGEIINISLLTGKFAGSLSVDSISFDNIPVGISFGNLIRINDTLIKIDMIGNRTVDYDSDITNINCTIKEGEFVGYAGPAVVAITPLTLTAFDEKLTVSASPELNKGNLDGAEISLQLTDDKFIDSQIELSNITLINAPLGLTVNSVDYISKVSAGLVLAFDGTNFATDINNFYISVNADELYGIQDLNSNELTIHKGVGINDNLNWEVKIYNNYNEVYISINQLIRDWNSATLTIFDELGKSVYSSDLQKVKRNKITLNVRSGNYFAKVNIDGTEFVNKLFILPK